MVEQISNISRLVQSYTNALFEIAVSSDHVQIINDELIVIENTIYNNKSLLKILNAVIIPYQEKLALIEAIAFNHKISDIVKSFILLLVSKNRFMYFGMMRDLFEKYRCEMMNQKILTCITANNLNEKSKQTISKDLEKIFKKKLNIRFEVDNNIIGGVILREGNIIYDCSIKNKLTLLEKQSKNYINAI